MTTLERFEGCLVGLAVGDALGYPHEFRGVAQVRAELGPAGITDFVALKDPRFSRPVILGVAHPPGTFTDDTQMSIALAEALVDSGHADLDALMGMIGSWFVAWYYSPDNNRAPGEATGIGCQRLRDGVPWREAGKQDSKGCGANMRVAPIGLFYESLDDVERIARAQACLTHRHPAADAGAAAAALCVALAARGVAPEEMHAEVARRCTGMSPDFDAVWGRVPAVLSDSPDAVLLDLKVNPRGLGESWVAEEAVASALYCHWRHPNDFQACVLEAANTEGDSDSIACIAGGISGAANGLAAIPARWQEGVEKAAKLRDLAQRLFAARRAGPEK